MIYFLLFTEFFKIGIFSLGGGYATLPFLYHMSETYHWFSADELSRMLAISSITPGPVGLNVATFAGYKTGGILGSVDATMAIMIPSFIIVIFISKKLKKYRNFIRKMGKEELTLCRIYDKIYIWGLKKISPLCIFYRQRL